MSTMTVLSRMKVNGMKHGSIPELLKAHPAALESATEFLASGAGTFITVGDGSERWLAEKTRPTEDLPLAEDKRFMRFTIQDPTGPLPELKANFRSTCFGTRRYVFASDFDRVPVLDPDEDGVVSYYLTEAEQKSIRTAVQRKVERDRIAGLTPEGACGWWRRKASDELVSRAGSSLLTIHEFEHEVNKAAVVMAVGMIHIAETFGLPKDHAFPTHGPLGEEDGGAVTYREAMLGHGAVATNAAVDLYERRVAAGLEEAFPDSHSEEDFLRAFARMIVNSVSDGTDDYAYGNPSQHVGRRNPHKPVSKAAKKKAAQKARRLSCK